MRPGERLRANWRPPRGEGGGAAREGRALLQGLIRCGRCGRRMQVGYSGKTLVPNYSCVRGNQLYGTERCQSVGGRRIELGRRSTPCSTRCNRLGLRRRSARSSWEAQTTRRGCAPSSWSSNARRSTPNEPAASSTRANRRTGLVARTLEREMGTAPDRGPGAAERGLTEVATEAAGPAHRARDRLVPGAPGASLTCARYSGSGAHHLRPRAQAAAARDSSPTSSVTVDRESEQHTADLRVVWEGGTITEQQRAAGRGPAATRAAPTRTRSRWCANSPSATPSKQIAAILARQRRRTGAGKPVHRPPRRRAARPPTRSRPAPSSDPPATMARWSRSRKRPTSSTFPTATVHRWLREGFITGGQITPGAPWEIRLTKRADDSGASASTRPTGGCRSPRPPRRSASPARPCCTRSNAASSPPSTSTAGSEKACESRSSPIKLDCLDNQIRQEAQWVNQRHVPRRLHRTARRDHHPSTRSTPSQLNARSRPASSTRQ